MHNVAAITYFTELTHHVPLAWQAQLLLLHLYHCSNMSHKLSQLTELVQIVVSWPCIHWRKPTGLHAVCKSGTGDRRYLLFMAALTWWAL